MLNNRSIYDENQEFIININKECTEKLLRLSVLIDTKIVDLKSYKNIEFITSRVMTGVKKSDEIFLLWLYAWGQHINKNFNSKWALIKYHESISKSYYPILISGENEIWLVGNDCEKAYYKNKRLRNIEFSFFYNIHCSRMLNKTKLADIETSIIELIEL